MHTIFGDYKEVPLSVQKTKARGQRRNKNGRSQNSGKCEELVMTPVMNESRLNSLFLPDN